MRAEPKSIGGRDEATRDDTEVRMKTNDRSTTHLAVRDSDRTEIYLEIHRRRPARPDRRPRDAEAAARRRHRRPRRHPRRRRPSRQPVRLEHRGPRRLAPVQPTGLERPEHPRRGRRTREARRRAPPRVPGPPPPPRRRPPEDKHDPEGARRRAGTEPDDNGRQRSLGRRPVDGDVVGRDERRRGAGGRRADARAARRRRDDGRAIPREPSRHGPLRGKRSEHAATATRRRTPDDERRAINTRAPRKDLRSSTRERWTREHDTQTT